MNEIELKPCKFCGSRAEVQMKFIQTDGKYACSSCGYRLAHDEYKDIVLNCPACGEKKEDENVGEQLIFEGAKDESEEKHETDK